MYVYAYMCGHYIAYACVDFSSTYSWNGAQVVRVAICKTAKIMLHEYMYIHIHINIILCIHYDIVLICWGYDFCFNIANCNRV